MDMVNQIRKDTYQHTDPVFIFLLPEPMDDLEFDQVSHIIVKLLPERTSVLIL